jgi:DNA-binding MltR family transcriptional regulator
VEIKFQDSSKTTYVTEKYLKSKKSVKDFMQDAESTMYKADMKQKQESFSDYVTWKLTPLIKILLQYED